MSRAALVLACLATASVASEEGSKPSGQRELGPEYLHEVGYAAPPSPPLTQVFPGDHHDASLRGFHFESQSEVQPPPLQDAFLVLEEELTSPELLVEKTASGSQAVAAQLPPETIPLQEEVPPPPQYPVEQKEIDSSVTPQEEQGSPPKQGNNTQSEEKPAPFMRQAPSEPQSSNPAQHCQQGRPRGGWGYRLDGFPLGGLLRPIWTRSAFLVVSMWCTALGTCHSLATPTLVARVRPSICWRLDIPAAAAVTATHTA